MAELIAEAPLKLQGGIPRVHGDTEKPVDPDGNVIQHEISRIE